MKKGQKQSEESIRKMREAHKGQKPWNKGLTGSIAGKGLSHNTSKRRIDNGYVRLYKPTHPMADRSGYILEHRYIMSTFLNRILESNEIVHHIDENTLNNSVDNLKITDRSKHIEVHFKPEEHSKKIIELRRVRFWSTKKK